MQRRKCVELRILQCHKTNAPVIVDFLFLTLYNDDDMFVVFQEVDDEPEYSLITGGFVPSQQTSGGTTGEFCL